MFTFVDKEKQMERMVKAEREEARQEGLQEGLQEGENLMAKLISILMEKGLFGEAKRAADDETIRQELYKKYNLI